MPRYLESRLIVFSASNLTVITYTLSLPIATQKPKLALKPKSKLNLFYYTLIIMVKNSITNQQSLIKMMTKLGSNF